MSNQLHNKLTELRKARKMTQEALAYEMQVTRQTIIAIEKGKYTPSLPLALSLAAYFNIPVEELFYEI